MDKPILIYALDENHVAEFESNGLLLIHVAGGNRLRFDLENQLMLKKFLLESTRKRAMLKNGYVIRWSDSYHWMTIHTTEQAVPLSQEAVERLRDCLNQTTTGTENDQEA